MAAHVVCWSHGVRRGVVWRLSHVGMLAGQLRLARGSGNGLRSGGRLSSCSLGVRRSLFAGDNVDQEVEHVGLGESGGDVGALEGSALILFGVDPGAHGQLSDEDITTLGEEDGGLGGDHLDFGVSLHDLLDAREGQLVDLVIMGVVLKVVDGVLPVGGQDVLVLAGEALVSLHRRVSLWRAFGLG